MKSNLMTLPDSNSVTSSPGSADGRSPCDGPDLAPPPEFGPAPVPVSRFRALASERDTPTSATFGPLFTRSSPSGDLQRCLESRLRARMDVNGSPEFALTWKDWDMPAGEPICALRASERRTGDKGCSGWPTPMAGTKATEDYNEAGNTDSGRRTVELCGWATPRACENDQGPTARAGMEQAGSAWLGQGRGATLATEAKLAAWPTPDTTDSNTRPNGKGGATMTDVARLAAWPTPQTEDSGESQTARKGGENLAVIAAWATPRAEDAESAGMRHSRGVADTLTAQAGQGLPLAGWATPDCQNHRDGETMRECAKKYLAEGKSHGMSLHHQTAQLVSGPAATSCPAGTGKRGVLRPGHSRWLMGYPAAWDYCGATAMQSCRKSRRSS